MTFFLRLAAAALLFVLAGCASIRSDMNQLDEKTSCCRTFADVKFGNTLKGETITIEINSESPVFSFDSGKAFFAAFELDSEASRRTLHLRTFFYGLTAIDAHFLYPAVVFLDRNYNVVTIAYPENLKYDPFGWQKKATWIGTIPVPTTAKYGIVHTPRNKVDTKFSGPAYAVGSTYMIGKTFLTIPGGNVTAVATFGGTGTLSVTLK